MVRYPIVIGVDPDSDKHGVAIYEEGILQRLDVLETFDLYLLAEKSVADLPTRLVVEDAASQNFIYSRNTHKNPKVQADIHRRTGRCQQAQVELVRMLQRLPIDLMLIKPLKGNWATNEKQFRQVTGWNGRSSGDKRSAAFFGWMGCN